VVVVHYNLCFRRGGTDDDILAAAEEVGGSHTWGGAMANPIS